MDDNDLATSDCSTDSKKSRSSLSDDEYQELRGTIADIIAHTSTPLTESEIMKATGATRQTIRRC